MIYSKMIKKENFIVLIKKDYKQNHEREYSITSLGERKIYIC